MEDEVVDQFLEHYGVRGMRWGVRNERPSGSLASNGSKKPDAGAGKYLAALKPLPKQSKAEEAVALAANEKKSKAKHGLGDSAKKEGASDEKGWRPTGKQVAYTAAGAAFVGLVVYGVVKERQFIRALPDPGDPIDAETFQKAVALSKSKSWITLDGTGYIKPQSFLQEEMVFPKGHTFHRLSTAAEKTMKGATYSTASKEDFNRYVTGFRGELEFATFGLSKPTFHHVTFKAREEVRVPTLSRTLDIFRESLSDGVQMSESEVLREFAGRSGGPWNDIVSERFFRRLSEQGYSAIVDQMDAGVIGEAPLVFTNPSAATRLVSRVMSSSDISSADNALTEMAGRIVAR